LNLLIYYKSIATNLGKFNLRIKKKIFVAGSWYIFAIVFSQLIRLASNLILTRLLAPEVFGVMAIVSVVAIGIAMFTDIGLWPFIVRHKDPENPHMLNVVWSIQVVRGWVMFGFILAIATILTFGNKLLPSYFHGIYANSLLPMLVLISGFASIIAGYASMASPVMHRKVDVGKLQIIELISQILGTSVMVIGVWLYPSIWFLVIGNLVITLVHTVLTYTFFSLKHKFIWDKAIVKEVFSFSKWIVISSILTYLFMQGDRLLFAAKVDANSLGIYSVAFMLASAITGIGITLAEKVIFPVFSSIVHDDRKQLKDKYYKVRFYLDLPMFFGAGLLIALGPFIVSFLYDSRYHDAGWMLQILALSIVGNTLSLISMECLLALSVTKVRMWFMLARTLGLFIGLPIFFNLYGFYGAIWVVALNAWIALPITYWSLYKNSIFNFYKEIRMLPFVFVGYLVGILFMRLIS
jgi:O-antigen/teichoic acid export membrane protein